MDGPPDHVNMKERNVNELLLLLLEVDHLLPVRSLSGIKIVL